MGATVTKQKSTGSDDIDALVARIFALRGDAKARATTDLTKSVAKGPKRARKK
jgi:hypothetical protein